MDAFVLIRKYISSNLLEERYISNLVFEHEARIKSLEYAFSKLEEKKKTNSIFFEGQIYDAYSKILNIFKTAKKNLIIIDNYADNTVLDMISKLNIQVTLITKENSKLKKLDLEKYNFQYNNLNVKYTDLFHDRFIVIDNKTIYHCGASINHAGKRAFAIDVIEDEDMKKALLQKIK